MSSFDVLKFIALFLTIYPAIVIPLYFGLRLAIMFGPGRDVNRRLPEIRKAVTDYWQSSHKDISTLLQEVPVEHLRVIGAGPKKENKRFRFFSWLFYLLSIALLIEGIAGMSCDSVFLEKHSSLALWSYSFSLIIQLISISWLGFATYYQYDYYKTLEDLHQEVTEHEDANRPADAGD